MKSFSLFIFIFVAAHFSWAQTANFSLPIKNSKNYDYAVLGKTTEGILLYKYNKYESLVECYDVSMNLKWSKNAEMDSKTNTIEHISVHNNKLYTFFSYKRDGNVILAAQRFSAGLNSEGKNVSLDSFLTERSAGDVDWFVKHSEDKRFYMAYYVKQETINSTAIQTILLDDKLKIISRKTITVAEPKKNMADELLDNNGNFYFFVANQDRSGFGSKAIFTKPRFYTLKKNEAISAVHFLSNDTKRFNSVFAKIDNINRCFILAGIAKEKSSEKNIPGFNVSKWLLDKDSLAVNQLETFTNEMVKEMTLTPETEIGNFEIEDIILRFDGGMVLVAENTYITQQTVEIPNYYSPAFPTVRTYTYFHKDDIFIQSFDASGLAEWHQLLHKKQTTENDGSAYSSFGIVKGKNSIKLFYNESIEEQSNLASYSIKQNGATIRNSIYGSHQKNLFLIPKKASQVSLYEAIIPSENRGYLQFMKIDF